MTTLQNSENIEEQVEIDELSQILNSTESSSFKLSMSRGADFCTTYNQIKGHIAPIISLLYKGGKLRILPSSWRNMLRNAAQLLELLKQFCDENCSIIPTRAWPVAPAVSANGRQVSIVAEDGHLYANWLDGTQWQWADQGNPSGTAFVTAPAVNADGGRVFVTAANGHLYLNWWDGTQWQWNDEGMPSGTRVVTAPAVVLCHTMING